MYGGAYDDEADRLPPLGPGVGGGGVGVIYDTPSGQYALPMQPAAQQLTPDQLSDWASTPESSEAAGHASGTLIKHSKGMTNLSGVLDGSSPYKASPNHRIYDTVENLAVAVQEEPQYDRINHAFGMCVCSVLHFHIICSVQSTMCDHILENNGDFSSDEWDSPVHSKVASPLTVGLSTAKQPIIGPPVVVVLEDQPSSLPPDTKQPTKHRRQSKNSRSLRSSHLAVLSRFNAAADGDRSSGSENNSPVNKQGIHKHMP